MILLYWAVSFSFTFLMRIGDGLYDKLSNEEISKTVWESINSQKGQNLHQALGNASESLVKTALLKKSLDNVTAIVLSFSNLESFFQKTLDSKATIPISPLSRFEQPHIPLSSSQSSTPTNYLKPNPPREISLFSRKDHSKIFTKTIDNGNGNQLIDSRQPSLSEHTPKNFLPRINSTKHSLILANHN